MVPTEYRVKINIILYGPRFLLLSNATSFNYLLQYASKLSRSGTRFRDRHFSQLYFYKNALILFLIWYLIKYGKEEEVIRNLIQCQKVVGYNQVSDHPEWDHGREFIYELTLLYCAMLFS